MKKIILSLLLIVSTLSLCFGQSNSTNTNRESESTEKTAKQSSGTEEVKNQKSSPEKKRAKSNLNISGTPGNVSTDSEEKYKMTKSEWYQKNNTNNSTSEKMIITKEEFDKLPPKRQKFVKDHPEKYLIK